MFKLNRLSQTKAYFFLAVSILSSACTPALTPESPDHSLTPWEKQLGTHNFGSTCFANATHKLLWAYYRDLQTPPTPSTSELGTRFNTLMRNFTAGWIQARNENQGHPSGYKEELSLLFEAFRKEQTSRAALDPITFQVQDGAETYLGRLNEYAQLFPDSFGIRKREEFLYPSDHRRNLIPYEATGQLALSLSIEDREITSVQQAIQHELRTTQQTGIRHPITDQPEDIQVDRYYEIDQRIHPSGGTPPVLIIGLNRIIHHPPARPIKLNKSVSPLAEIEIPLSQAHPQRQNDQDVHLIPFSNPRYELKSVVVHHGSASGGHYFTYIRNTDQSWEKHNDRSVRMIHDPIEIQKIEEDINTHGYLLLYTRIEA